MIRVARLAFGGMAATPRRAAGAEAALQGQPWSADSLERAASALMKDFTPLTDMRASDVYRLAVASNLLRRFWLEREGGVPARVLDIQPVSGEGQWN